MTSLATVFGATLVLLAAGGGYWLGLSRSRRLASTLEGSRLRLEKIDRDLARERGEAEAILAGVSEGVFAVDRERRLTYLNPQAAKLLGTTVEAARGRFCGDVLRPVPQGEALPCEQDCPILHARFRGATTAGERLRRGGPGELAVVITSATPTVAQGEIWRQIQVLREETAVEAARRLRDHVVANVSHEFKTPLAAQLAAIELLETQVVDLPEARTLVFSLERGTLRLSQLVDNLLESVRLEAGQSSIRRRPVALDEVIEEAVELTAPLLAQRGQRLTQGLPCPLPEVSGDAPRLQQVLVNLLANANKYAPEGSTITLGGELREGEIALWVDDEGPGPAAGDEEALFERFFRATEREPDAGGMGLGLAIVRSIVERHGGRVRALKQTVAGRREGGRFVVTLPLPVTREDES